MLKCWWQLNGIATSYSPSRAGLQVNFINRFAFLRIAILVDFSWDTQKAHKSNAGLIGGQEMGDLPCGQTCDCGLACGFVGQEQMEPSVCEDTKYLPS